MANATCTVNNVSTLDGYNSVPSAAITIQLLDKTASFWTLTVYGVDDLSTDPVITINSSAKTATLTMPSDARGSTVLLKSSVNDESTTFGIFAIGTSGRRLLAANQTIEGNHEYGWIADLNQIINLISV